MLNVLVLICLYQAIALQSAILPNSLVGISRKTIDDN